MKRRGGGRKRKDKLSEAPHIVDDAGDGADEEEEDVDQTFMNEQMTSVLDEEIDDYLEEDDEVDVESTALTERLDELPYDDGGFSFETNAADDPEREIQGLITVLNNVVTATLTDSKQPPYATSEIDLLEVVVRGARLGFQLNARRFQAAILSCVKPTCCVLVFQRGKIVCAGCANIDDATMAIEKTVGYLREIRASYANLHAIDIRVRNMVGTVCVPYNIDVEKLYAENPRVISGMIKTCVTLAPPPPPRAAPEEKTRRNQRRKAGSTLVYWSGYLVIIGAKSSAEMVRAFNYAYPIVKNYFIGSAEATFSVEKLRRYYTSLKLAYENSEKAPKSFIAVRANGTEGSVNEWRSSPKVIDSIAHYKQLADNPLATLQSRLLAASNLAPETIEGAPRTDDPSSLALVQHSGGGELVLATAENALVAHRAVDSIKQSNATRKQVVGALNIIDQVAQIEEAAMLQALVDGECGGSTLKAAKRMRPKQLAPMTMDKASQMYHG